MAIYRLEFTSPFLLRNWLRKTDVYGLTVRLTSQMVTIKLAHRIFLKMDINFEYYLMWIFKMQ